MVYIHVKGVTSHPCVARVVVAIVRGPVSGGDSGDGGEGGPGGGGHGGYEGGFLTSKIMTVIGAGISTKDFRSKNGFYSLGYCRLFYSTVLSDPERKPLFYNSITKIRQVVKRASLTRTHRFIFSLRNTRKLVQDYAQNIECLEEKVGLSTDLRKGPGSRPRFCRKYRPTHVRGHHRVDHEPRLQERGVECILLYGSLCRLRCSNCFSHPCTNLRALARSVRGRLSGCMYPCLPLRTR
ncbi:hypothetical protein B0T26DRAFT_102167 [Lasiosphaeria miniovina]|uniref:Uncharacterized protein n=1 Tax=Lasiosphaeria miniovina TaxID=1954250 RepID=A0AA40E8X1_9PEZI|nr:uncharacterized protein B0T26DRAFT_102167 [Lasiosphaeria miniovina]KAK0726753.1 hypothetical protein B0T26DRAFT_102167 [Lasiosphaeria miniovina]